jgi:hypothetical protein
LSVISIFENEGIFINCYYVGSEIINIPSSILFLYVFSFGNKGFEDLLDVDGRFLNDFYDLFECNFFTANLFSNSLLKS